MVSLMIHRTLSTREGKLMHPGTYKVMKLRGRVGIYSVGKVNLLMGTMDFEPYNRAINEGWATVILDGDLITVQPGIIRTYENGVVTEEVCHGT